jgi:hypothetical protein
VDQTLEIFDIIHGTPCENSMWWPVVVVGAYATIPGQRIRLLSRMGSFTPPMPIVSRGMQLLKAIWDAPEDVFGLNGLSRVVEQRDGYCFG